MPTPTKLVAKSINPRLIHLEKRIFLTPEARKIINENFTPADQHQAKLYDFTETLFDYIQHLHLEEKLILSRSKKTIVIHDYVVTGILFQILD